jgi:spoIIIJ-associated protein
MSSRILEIEEKSIDEAIEKACLEFGVPREKLNIEIISGESGGFLGLFSKKAKIKASLVSLDMDFSFTDHPKAKSESKIEHREKPAKEVIPEKKILTEKPGKKTEPVVSSSNFIPVSKASVSKIKIEPRVKPAKKVIPEKKILTEKPGKQAEPVVYSSNAVLASNAKDLLEGILQRISLECKVTVNETPEKIILDIEGDNSGLLIGKRGQNIDALQYILNKAINKFDNGHKMILIDSGEYRKRREEFLLGLAEKIRERVKKTLKPVSLAHMNAHDRRIIHMVLQEDESLITQSRGEGKYRKIVILPAKAGNTKSVREKNHGYEPK